LAKKNKNKNKKIHMDMTRGDSTQSSAMMCSQGVTRGILTLQGGIYEKFFYRGIAKLANIAGGISLLTLIS
jgi:hypothetical protein